MTARLADVGLADLPSAVLVFGADGRLEDANAAACELLGQDRERLLRADSLPAAIAAAGSGRSHRGVLAQIERQDGSTVWVQVDADRMSPGHEAVAVATLTDVTALIGEMAPSAPDYAARGLADMTQQEFAHRIGIAQSHLSALEHGEREPGSSVLLAISREFGKSVDWLLTGEGKK